MTLHAAWLMDTQGVRAARQAISLIKFFGARVLHDVVDRALQIHGSLGYSTDMPLEAMYRYARGARFYDGPDEVHRESVARQILRGYEPPAGAVRAHAHAPRGCARALRVAARGGHRERLRSSGPRRRRSAAGGARRSRGGAEQAPGTHGGRRDARRPSRPAPSTASTSAAPWRCCASRSALGPAARRARRLLRRLAAAPAHAAAAAGASRPCRTAAGCATSSARCPAGARRSSIGAHYDTEARPRGFVGANDGAAGTAAVVELARALRAQRPARRRREVRFVLFDGEEEPARQATSSPTGLRGTTRLRRRAPRRGRRDGAPGLRRRPRPAAPARGGTPTRALWARLRAAARRVGRPARVFPTARRSRSPTTTRRSLARGRPGDRPDRLRLSLARTPFATRLDKVSPRSLDVAGRGGRSSCCAAARVLGRAAPTLGSDGRSREAPARRPARLLRRRRPRRADRRARARALRRAGLRAQGDRPQQARGRAAARARRDLRRGARRPIPEGAITVFSAHGVSPAVHAEAHARAACRRSTRPARWSPRSTARRSSSPPRATRSCSSATPATRRSRARWARRPTTSCCRDRGGRRRLEVEDPERDRLHLADDAVGRRDARDHRPPARALPEHHRAAHRRHLLRDDQPPGRGQADGRRSATSCWSSARATRRTPTGWSRSRASTAPRRT